MTSKKCRGGGKLKRIIGGRLMREAKCCQILITAQAKISLELKRR
jgi:hypothetical protein